MPWSTSLTPTACPARGTLRLIYFLYKQRRPQPVTTTQDVGACRTGGFLFECEMHAFMTTVLLGTLGRTHMNVISFFVYRAVGKIED